MEEVVSLGDFLSSKEEINKLWLDSFYWTFKWRFEDLAIDDCFSSRKEFRSLGEFSFSIQKISKEAFLFQVMSETPSELRTFHEGYQIKFYIFMPGRITFVKSMLLYDTHSVSVEFNYREICSALKNTEIWTVRCVIYVSERTCLENERRYVYNTWIGEMLAKVPDKKTITEMLRLLKRPFRYIFTGRETEMFALQKLNYIKRTFKYAHVIYEKFLSEKHNENYEPSTPVEVYLGYIYSEDVRSINKEQVIKLYLDAHSYGLSYLVKECRNFMLQNVDDDEYLVSILMASDMVWDPKLGLYAFSAFNAKSERIMKTNSWKILANDQYPVMQSILNTARLWVLSLVHRQIDHKELFLSNLTVWNKSDTVLQNLLDDEESERSERDEDSSMEESSDEECLWSETGKEWCYHIDSVCSFDSSYEVEFIEIGDDLAEET